MGGPTRWEVHEYQTDGSPVLAFEAWAGGHGPADQFGTTWYVEREEGWRDGAALRDTSLERLAGDGSWDGPQWKQPTLVTLSGIYISSSQEAQYASIRQARNTLGRTLRRGRLLAHDSDGKRLYANVTRGGKVLINPTSPLVGEWSMSFLINDPTYLSEETPTTTIYFGGYDQPPSGRAYTKAYRYAYQSASNRMGDPIEIVGDTDGHFRLAITGPTATWNLVGPNGGVLSSNSPIASGTTAVLDTASRTYTRNGVNARWEVSGKWFMLRPGLNVPIFTVTGGNTDTTLAVLTYNKEVWAG